MGRAVLKITANPLASLTSTEMADNFSCSAPRLVSVSKAETDVSFFVSSNSPSVSLISSKSSLTVILSTSPEFILLTNSERGTMVFFGD